MVDHEKQRKIGKTCLNCSKTIANRNTYCNNMCQAEYQNKLRYDKFMSGEFDDLGRKDTIERVGKRFLIKTHGNKCMKCGWCEINKFTNKIPIELNHIDGNPENNDLNNLELLCPNCHSLTPYYKSRGKGRKWRKTVNLNKPL